MQKSKLRGRHGVIASSPRSNDPGCSQHPDFRPAQSTRIARTDILDDYLGPRYAVGVSGDVFTEYEEVLRRPRFSRSSSEIIATLRAIREKGFRVKPTKKVDACSDPDDNIFVECAQAAAAHYLVTGNAKDFPATWSGTQIVTAREFLDAVL
jgi:uncharacterized protein